MAKIDIKEIPEVEMRMLVRAALEAARKFYSDPENVKKFEEWKREQADGEDKQD